jgi:hypothetical protein
VTGTFLALDEVKGALLSLNAGKVPVTNRAKLPYVPGELHFLGARSCPLPTRRPSRRMVARYREELLLTANASDAMRIAWRASLGPVGASGSTVILGMLCLLASDSTTTAIVPTGAATRFSVVTNTNDIDPFRAACGH